jgi:hypothetical protein
LGNYREVKWSTLPTTFYQHMLLSSSFLCETKST